MAHLIVDSHLDLSFNALRGRDLRLAAADQAPDELGPAAVGFPDLRQGGVGLIASTLFCLPAKSGHGGYATPAEARAMALEHLRWHQEQFDAGELRLVRHVGQLPSSAAAQARDERPRGKDAIAALLLLEGAEMIESVEDVVFWWARGVRIVGLAWKGTIHCGGTGEPGPLTPLGRQIAKALDGQGFIHDCSHLAEESFWQLLELADGPVMASHSNCRALVPGDRQLSDLMIVALVQRGGIVGINFFDRFLLKPDSPRRRATLNDVIAHIDHIVQLTGSARYVGLGTDMDGGLSRDQIPVEIRSSADLPRLAEALSAAGYGDADVRGIMGENWLAYYRKNLPAGK